MRQSELNHAIRAAAQVLQRDHFLIIGSQSILGTWHESDLPSDATMSVEVDMCPLGDDDAQSLATLLEGAIGELSLFHETHGFYVQGVGLGTAILPAGWQDRLVPVSSIETNYAIGLCLDPTDLCAAKLAAHRDKDYLFVAALLNAGLIDVATLRERVALLPPGDDKPIATRWAHAYTPPLDVQPQLQPRAVMPPNSPDRFPGLGM